jgi:HD-GYP domain-containing protein (c-di-GMP phosphodiesterase class II)
MSGVRRAEIMAALSMATDLAIGQPAEFALKSCVLGVRLGEKLKLGREEIHDIYYQALLRYIGCNAETYAMTALLGDEIEFRRKIATLDLANPAELMPVLLLAIIGANADAPLPTMLWGVTKSLARSKSETAAGLAGHCEVAERFARRFGFSASVIRNLGQLYERWDGRGLPHGLKREAIAPAVRVVTLAQDIIVLVEAHGLDAAVAIMRKRRGKAYDPRMVDCLIADAQALMADLDAHSSWDAVLALEPEPQAGMSEAEFDEACLAIADFIDIKSPFTLGHSRAVAELAAEAGRHCGLPAADVAELRRAALVHDIGLSALTTAILIKPGALSDSEWERMRLHPYHAERILARPAALARLGQIAGAHHERIDGSGYHRGARGNTLTPSAKILAAAEAYQAMIEERPYRPARSPEEAAALLKRDVREGRLDAEAVTAVLAAAGHRVAPLRRELVAGLTARELAVLRLVAHGKSMKEIARALSISPKTVDNHLQHLYAKIGVKTRAGATLFAIEHGLGTVAER